MSTDLTKKGHSFRPTKKLGQNFLIDKTVVNRIVESAELTSQDVIIEVGPGKGAITGKIAGIVKKIYAIEKDRFLFEKLEIKYSSTDNLEIINKDALDIKFKSFQVKDKIKFIANLPYNITSPILSMLTEERDLFSMIIIMIQKEVSDRISANPGNKTYGALSVLIQTFFDTKALFTVKPGSFSPKPKVDSAVIKLIPIQKYSKKIKDPVLFISVVRSSFSSRRKMISNSLRNEFGKEIVEDSLAEAGISSKRRAETLSVSEFIELGNKFYELQQSTSSSKSSF